MRLSDFFKKPHARKPASSASNWSRGYNARDWADLPVHHPRADRTER